jgi:menaquinone-dependent protoporphyrinogen oxidase
LSVSLAARSRDARKAAAARTIAEKFLAETGLAGATMHLAAGAVHKRELNWVTRWMMREILAKRGVEPDPSGDTVFTDYVAFDAFDAFDAFVDAFSAGL